MFSYTPYFKGGGNWGASFIPQPKPLALYVCTSIIASLRNKKRFSCVKIKFHIMEKNPIMIFIGKVKMKTHNFILLRKMQFLLNTYLMDKKNPQNKSTLIFIGFFRNYMKRVGRTLHNWSAV
jgi:hypothetical protein